MQNTFYRLSQKLTISYPKVLLYIPPKKKRKKSLMLLSTKTKEIQYQNKTKEHMSNIVKVLLKKKIKLERVYGFSSI